MIKKNFVFFIAVLFLTGCYRKMPMTEKMEFKCMGTRIEIILNSRQLESIDKKLLYSDIKDKAEKFEEKYSVFSENNLMNKINSSERIEVDSSTIDLLKKANQLALMTEGSYDYTVFALLEIWGFYSDKKKFNIPTSYQIKNALKNTGYKEVLIDQNNMEIIKENKNIKFDLAGIAKGFFVDEIVSLLKQKGITSGLVNAGGDMFCLGFSAESQPWIIGIQHPRKRNGIIGKLSLENIAIATSGDYENFHYAGEKRYSHIINPKTGSPAENGPIEATVIAPYTFLADGLATAFIVMGADKALEFANKNENIEAVIVTEENSKIKVYITDGLKKGKYSFSVNMN